MVEDIQGFNPTPIGCDNPFLIRFALLKEKIYQPIDLFHLHPSQPPDDHLEQRSRKGKAAFANMRFEALNVWVCTSTSVATQLHLQKAIFVFDCGLSKLVDFLDYIFGITEESSSK